MDEKNNEVRDEDLDVITVVEDYEDFQTLVKERKKDVDKETAAAKDELKADSVTELKEVSGSMELAGVNNSESKEKSEENKNDNKKADDSIKTSKDKKSTDGKEKSEEKKADESKKLSEDKKPSESKEKSEEKKADESKKLSEDKKPSDNKEKSEVKNTIDNTKKDVDKKSVDNNTPYIDNKTKAPSGKKIFGICFGVLAGLLIIAYAAGFVYFSSHFYQYVTVNGIDVSGMNKDSAKNVLDNFYKNYNIELETIDTEKYTIDGKDIDAKVTVHDSFDELFAKQEPYLWFINYFNHHEFNVDASATWNEGKLKDVLSSMDFLDEKNMVAPEDAYIGVDDGTFSIIKEVLGTTIDQDKFDSTLKSALSSVQSKLNLYAEDCYTLPKIYSDNEELVKEYEGKKEFAQYVINIQMDDLKLEPGMELYDAVLEKSGDGYQISRTKVVKYVNDLANQYDTMGKERTFTTSFGGRKITTTGTAFGYELDKEATVDALYSALTGKKSTTVDAVFISKGKSLQGENDIGDTYVEVNLSEQRVIAYKDGKKFAEGDCVSGNESAGHGTTTGLYEVQDKLSPTVLRGEKQAVTKTVKKKNKKGKKVEKTVTTYEYEYESPVTYWLQFNGGQGLHDAAGWRSAYGGSIYYYSGSHGCVNLPLDLARQLYETIQVGDPVIVYFWDNENRK